MRALEFLVNGTPPKPLDVVTSNVAMNRSHDAESTEQILCDLEGQRSNYVFSCKCISSPTVGRSNLKHCR